MYFKSVNSTVDHYRIYLQQLHAGSMSLADVDFDTGKKTAPGEYPLTDLTYAKLLHRLAQRNFQGVDPSLRANLTAFFSDPNALADAKKDPKKWREAQHDIEQLRGMAAS